MKAHVIEDGVVINTIEVDSLDFMPNLVEATDGGIGWSYVDGVFTAPVVVVSDEDVAQQVRRRRDSLLSESDWVTVKAVDQNAADNLGIQVPQVWLDYRQALRDITAQDGFPHNVIWPEVQ
jgi:hypothetical protein